MNVSGTARFFGLAALCSAALAWQAGAQENKTVIGPSNLDLHAGAEALQAGDAEEGLRLTMAGLKYAASPADQAAGLSNACAAYLLLDDPAQALAWCDKALSIRARNWQALANRSLAYLKLGRYEEAESDVTLAEQLAPGSQTVKAVRALLLDATHPVTPHIVIDDRRQPADDEPQ